MLRLKLNHVSKSGHWWQAITWSIVDHALWHHRASWGHTELRQQAITFILKEYKSLHNYTINIMLMSDESEQYKEPRPGLNSFIGLIALDNEKLPGGQQISSSRLPEGQLENEQISSYIFSFVKPKLIV